MNIMAINHDLLKKSNICRNERIVFDAILNMANSQGIYSGTRETVSVASGISIRNTKLFIGMLVEKGILIRERLGWDQANLHINPAYLKGDVE